MNRRDTEGSGRRGHKERGSERVEANQFETEAGFLHAVLSDALCVSAVYLDPKPVIASQRGAMLTLA
jgi:hypothetical protein